MAGSKMLFKERRWVLIRRVQAASEQVNCAVSVLGPGMNGEVRFGNQYKSRNALGSKLMKMGV